MHTAAIDKSGRLLWLQHMIPGADGKQAIGRKVWDTVVPEDRDQIAAAFGRAMVTGKPVEWNCAIPSDGGAANLFGEYHPTPKRVAVIATWRAEDSRIVRLTPTERSVARYLACYEVKKIARIMDRTVSTVETHRRNIATKVGLSGVALIVWCYEQFS